MLSTPPASVGLRPPPQVGFERLDAANDGWSRLRR